MVFWEAFNPFTPKSDQCQISPAASPEILHHTVWRTWLFIAYYVDKWLYYQFSLHHSYISLLKGWENVLLELGSERVKTRMLEAKAQHLVSVDMLQSVAKLVTHSVKFWNFLDERRTTAKKKCRLPNFPPPPQSMLITLSGTMVISCLVNIVQGGGGEVLPRFGMLENSPKTFKCVITFETDCSYIVYANTN